MKFFAMCTAARQDPSAQQPAWTRGGPQSVYPGTRGAIRIDLLLRYRKVEFRSLHGGQPNRVDDLLRAAVAVDAGVGAGGERWQDAFVIGGHDDYLRGWLDRLHHLDRSRIGQDIGKDYHLGPEAFDGQQRLAPIGGL